MNKLSGGGKRLPYNLIFIINHSADFFNTAADTKKHRAHGAV